MSATNSHSAKQFWIIAYLLIGCFAALIAAYQYMTGDVMRAIFWLCMVVVCEVSIIRKNVDE